MRFKNFHNMEDWQKINIIKNLDKDHSLLIEFTIEDLKEGFQKENEELRKKMEDNNG
jgi:hypothetical protein